MVYDNPLLASFTTKFVPTPASVPSSKLPGRLRESSSDTPNSHPLNPVDFILRAATIYPDKVAIVHPNVRQPVFYTFSVWAQRIQNLAYALLQAGIRPGDRVAVLAPNSPLIADAHWGILAARAVLTPINTRLTKPEVEYILEHSGSRLILIDYEFAHLIPESVKAKARVVVSNDTGRSGCPYEAFLTSGREFSREMGWGGLDKELDENANAVLCYTSGTTGRPKGVITTLRGTYLAGIANVFECQLSGESVYLWILPMFHAAGWTFPYSCVFAFSTQITLRTVDYTLMWQHFLQSDVTHYCGAPTVQIGVVNYPKKQKLTRPVKAIIAGAAPTAHVIGKLEEIGITPIHVYGLTETYGPFMRSFAHPSWYKLPLADRAKLLARQGFPFATALDARVVYLPTDENKSKPDELVDVPMDGKTMGEIITRGNIVMKEYFRDDEATKKAFQGGWFHSGDLAVMQPDGTIAILDRSKDIIISGGENASSLAIEQELSTHPDVLEVAVVARIHEKWGERAHAFVILHPEHLNKWKHRVKEFEAELRKYARGRLPGFACPEWVDIVAELPKTSTGKIQKNELRKIVAKL